jgi:DNA-binding transcriptional ArsR family regulator
MATASVPVDVDALARIGTALADDSRRRLLIALLDGPRYPAELADALALTRTNVSNHLACLRGCGLVVTVPEGRRVRYQLADRRIGRALRTLAEVILDIDPSACEAAARGEDCC